MVRKLTIDKFIESAPASDHPVTKFGGQPDWLEAPTWPVSAGWERPMQFICQIDLSSIFKTEKPKMAYIFVTHALFEEKDEFFDPDIIFPDEGENAVIIQPGVEVLGDVEELKAGPSLYTADGDSCEFHVQVTEATDPEFLSTEAYQGLPDEQRKRYFDAVYGNKIGGVPAFFQGDEWPDEEEKWNLLLQFNSDEVPCHLNFGASPLVMVFVSEDLRRGRIVIQDS